MTELYHTFYAPESEIASATAFQISAGLGGPMDARPSAANPIVRAVRRASAFRSGAETITVLSAVGPSANENAVADGSGGGVDQIMAVASGVSGAVGRISPRRFAVGQNIGRGQTALELWIRQRGKQRETTPL